jgi:hypothetical protein
MADKFAVQSTLRGKVGSILYSSDFNTTSFNWWFFTYYPPLNVYWFSDKGAKAAGETDSNWVLSAEG